MDEAKGYLDAWNRKCRTVWYWSQLYLLYKTAQARGRFLTNEQRKKFWEEKHLLLAEMVWSNITTLRGCWVKVGQFLSTRSDMLPEQYITYLARLQDTMPCSPFSIIKPILEREIGCSVNSVFSHFEEEAFASASIAQVHRATLCDGNQPVAVKVQHPEVERTLHQDMLTLTQISWALGVVEKAISVSPIVEEWRKAAMDELDFRTELRNQQRAYSAAKRSNIAIKIPECFPSLTSKRVMVMEYSHGFKITDQERFKEHQINQDSLVHRICSFFAYQIHIDGMFNGDPHPGNILVEIDSKTNEAIPVLLDWGLVKHFSNAQRFSFSSAVYCITNMDILGFNAAMQAMGFEFKGNLVTDPEVYIEAFSALATQGFGHRSVDISPTEKFSSELKCNESFSEKNPIDDWPKDIIFLIRVASLLHGLSVQLKAKVSFLDIFSEKATQCLLERYKRDSCRVLYRYPPMKQGRVRSWLEWKIYRLLVHLAYRDHSLLGCQVAVFKDNAQIVDLCIGQLGLTDRRPVERSTLFPLLVASHGIVTTAVLQLIDGVSSFSKSDGHGLELNDPVCHWWDGFIRFGKESITVYDVLTHRSGLHEAFPYNLRLSELVNYETMISFLEDATPKPPYGSLGGRYAYLTSSWILSELVQGVTGQPIDRYVYGEFIYRLGLDKEFFFRVPECFTKKEFSKKISPSNAAKNNKTHQKKDKTSASEKSDEDQSILTPDHHNLQGISSLVSDTAETTPPLSQRRVIHKERQHSPKDSAESFDYNNSSADSFKKTNGLKGFPSMPSTGVAGTSSCGTLHPKKMVLHELDTPSHKAETRHNPVMNHSASISRPIRFHDVILQKLNKQMEMLKESTFSEEKDTQKKEKDILTAYPLSLSSKYLSKVRLSQNQSSSHVNDLKRLSPLQLMKKKPYVLDPIIYNSSVVQTSLLPGSNCRATARALAYFYSCLANGTLLSSHLLDQASEIYTVDDSLDTLILTGGSSRLFGLGYQLFPCLQRIGETPVKKKPEATEINEAFNRQSKHFNHPSFRIPPVEHEPSFSLDSQDKQKSEKKRNHKNKLLSSTISIENHCKEGLRIVRGIGHSDTGGSIGLCFPELRLSIAILVNKFFTGPEASKRILRFILSCFNLTPCWDIPYTAKSFACDFQRAAASSTHSDVTTILQNESKYHATKLSIPTSNI